MTAAAMVASFYLLSLSLRTLAAGTAYATWTRIGAVGAAIRGIFLLDEPRAFGRLASTALIVAGIIGLKLSHS